MKDRAEFIGGKFGGGSPYMRVDLLAQLKQAQQLLGDKPYILDTPTLSLVDLSLAKSIFFLSNVAGPDFVEEHVPTLARHMQRIFAEAGMDRTKEMPKIKAEQALEIARDQYQPFAGQGRSVLSELKIGNDVTVSPLDTGRVPSKGILCNLTEDEIAIEHKTGDIASIIHFPAFGFIVTPAPTPSL